MGSIAVVVLILYLIYIVVRLGLSFKQIGFIKKSIDDKAVILEKDEYVKAGKYAIEKERVAIYSTIMELALFLFFTLFALGYMDKVLVINNVLVKSIVFMIVFFIINGIVTMPIDIYKKFSLDKRYGFSNMSVKLYIADLIKSTIIALIFIGLLVLVLSFFILNLSNWWTYGFVLTILVVIFINMLYPTVIAPIFNKVELLKDEDMRDSIEGLLDKVKFKSSGVYSMDASKRDGRLNAYFGGFGKSKRVVLFDTLLEKLSKNELLAVLGHELGHYKNGDVYKNIIITAVMLFILFFIFGHFNSTFFSSYNLADKPYMLLSFFMLLSAPISFFMIPFVGAISRSNEFGADKFGSDLVSKEELSSALLKLVKENRSFPKSDPLYIKFYYTHPPILERLKELGYDC